VSEDAQTIAAERGIHTYDSILLEIIAYAQLIDGRFVEARPFLDRIRALVDSTRLFDTGLFYFLHAWDAWRDGRLGEAREAAQTSLECAYRMGDLHGLWQTTFALVHIEISLGNRPQAFRHLAAIRHWHRRVGGRQAVFARALALAGLAHESGNATRCRHLLRIALALGRKEGYVSVLFLTPEMLARLCAEALDAGIEVNYARFLIRKRDLKPPPDAALSEHWPWPVKVTTLGGLSLRVNGEPVQWPRKAQHKPIDLSRALVAYGGRGVPSGRLIDELWPEAEGDTAASAFKTTLHRLRKILGREDAVQLRDGQVSLNSRCVWLDRWALEQVLEEVVTASSIPPTAQTLDTLDRTSQRLLSLYRGRFLEKSDLPCAAAPREVLHRKYLLAVERLGEAFEATGMPEKARAIYERALDVDPTAESIHQKLTPGSKDA
jgi:LuxR family maltose regulon positive regulatory protein